MLSEAMMDLRAEVLAGHGADEVAPAIAADYGINPALLVRKFRESYRSEDGLRAIAAATNRAAVMPGKIQAEVERVCKYYRVPASSLQQTTFRGKRYTVIGRLPRGRRVAVCHDDARAYRLPA